jgi:hypothetical protein
VVGATVPAVVLARGAAATPVAGSDVPMVELRDARLPIHRVMPCVVVGSMVRLCLPEEVRGVYTGHSCSVVLLVEMRQNWDA